MRVAVAKEDIQLPESQVINLYQLRRKFQPTPLILSRQQHRRHILQRAGKRGIGRLACGPTLKPLARHQACRELCASCMKGRFTRRNSGELWHRSANYCCTRYGIIDDQKTAAIAIGRRPVARCVHSATVWLLMSIACTVQETPWPLAGVFGDDLIIAATRLQNGPGSMRYSGLHDQVIIIVVVWMRCDWFAFVFATATRH